MPIWENLPEDVLRKAQELGVDFKVFQEKFVRGGGKGGQKINKTSSTVWLKDPKTGLEVKVQKHRELSANRVSAYKLLVRKIEDQIKGRESERAQQIFKLRKQKKKRSKKAKEKLLEQKRQRKEVKESRKKFIF